MASKIGPDDAHSCPTPEEHLTIASSGVTRPRARAYSRDADTGSRENKR